MFSLTGNAPAAEAVFAHATKCLGQRDPRELVQTEPLQVLHDNRVAQILCASQALSAAAALRHVWPKTDSLGRLQRGRAIGLGCCGVARQCDDARSRGTEGGTDGCSKFTRGRPAIRTRLSRASVDNLCRRHSTAVAIVNPNDAFVLGGSGESLDILAVDAMRMGAAHVTRIAVNVASHTVRLAAASSAFQAALEHTPTKRNATSRVRLFQRH